LQKFSIGVRCAWQIASWEAALVKSSHIEPEHLLIGIFSLHKVNYSKTFKTMTSEDQQRLKTEQVQITAFLKGLNISVEDFRRRLRGELPRRRFTLKGKIIHRSEEARRCFKHAEDLANHCAEFDVLLLLAAIMSRPGRLIEQVCTELGVPSQSLWIKALTRLSHPDNYPQQGISSNDFVSIQTFTRNSQSSLLTIMFDDIVGSMVLYHKLGDDEFLKLIKFHDMTIRKIITRNGQGEIIKSTGDGLLMVFSNPVIAIQCALDVQKEFLTHDLLKIRIGMDMGEVKEVGDEKSRDILGIRVSSANRIMCAAEGGHILTSRAIYEEMQQKETEIPLSWKYLGWRRFKPGEPTIDVYEVYHPQSNINPMKELPPEISTESTAKPIAGVDNHSLLVRFGKNLTQKAAEGQVGPFAERRNEILQIIQTLAQRYSNNPLLIGKAGVGKSALVEALALRLNQCANLLPRKRIVELNMNLLLAGIKDKNECEQRLYDLLQEVETQTDLILYIDEIHNFVGSGKQDLYFTVAHFMNPAIIHNKIQCIGTTNPDEYNRCIKSEASLERGFQKIMIQEPGDKEMLEMLSIFRQKLEEYHHIWITDRALEAAMVLSKQFDPEHSLPAKAIDLLDEAGAQIHIPDLKTAENKQPGNSPDSEIGMSNKILNVMSIATVVSRKADIPIKKILTALEEQKIQV
jgi:ATP-dependent Clp protease ATP-binding subunit ClpA